LGEGPTVVTSVLSEVDSKDLINHASTSLADPSPNVGKKCPDR
jgi:hypothetical protein